jgi:NAD-dependent dihydropyrimidine dehydrogenase PreA subunit
VYKLILTPSDCVSCGTCMDVCPPGAIDMHRIRKAGVEQWLAPGTGGGLLADAGGPGIAWPGYMTFPFLARPDLCDGCLACVRECPTVALVLRPGGQAGSPRARSTECSAV